MRILLVKPPQDRRVGLHIMPPLGLGYLASSIKRINITPILIDCVLSNLSYKDLLSKIGDLKPQIVCFTVYTHDLNNIKMISSLIKNKVSSKIIIIVGGPHPSTVPEHTLDYLPNVDFAFKGEAEIGLPLLVEYLQNRWPNYLNMEDKILDQIPSLVRRKSKNYVQINNQIFVEDLDTLGFPDWELLNPHNYLKTCQGVFFKSNMFAPIFTTRGCPKNCNFCAAHNIMGEKVRRRSINHIIEEILYLKQEYGIKEFHILDDNFTEEKNFVISFCKEILIRNIDIFWDCPNGIRIDCIDEEILDFMKSSGCYSIFLGIESGSQRILDKMNKGLKISQIKQIVNLVKKKGFNITGFFIIGYPGENKEDMNATINFARNLPLDAADFNNFQLLPGTVIFRQLFKNDLDKIDFDHLSSPSYIINIGTDTSYKRLQKNIIRKSYLKFYLRPHILIKLLLRIRNRYQIYFIFKRLIIFLL